MQPYTQFTHKMFPNGLNDHSKKMAALVNCNYTDVPNFSFERYVPLTVGLNIVKQALKEKEMV